MPDGTLVVGRGRGFHRLLDEAAGLSGTPLARAASAARERIAACETFGAYLEPAGGGAAESAVEPVARGSFVHRLGCLDGSPPAGLAAALGLLDRPPGWAGAAPADWLLARTWGDGGRAVAWGWADPAGGHALAIELTAGDAAGAWSLLLPAAEPPGPPRLADAGSLIHARVRPDGGLDLASRIDQGGAAAELFRLRNELFLATALDGTWELAVYHPEEGQRIPPAALALDVRDRDRAVTAIEAFIADVRETWAVSRRPTTLAGHPGACLDDLNLMPELAPCYAATPEVLVIGWNAGSVERALAPPANGAGASPLAAALSSALVHLDRLPEADARLARAGSSPLTGPPPEPLVYPWRLLRLAGERVGEHYRVAIELIAADAGGGAPPGGER